VVPISGVVYISGVYKWYISVVSYALFWDATARPKPEITQISVMYVSSVYQWCL